MWWEAESSGLARASTRKVRPAPGEPWQSILPLFHKGVQWSECILHGSLATLTLHSTTMASALWDWFRFGEQLQLESELTVFALCIARCARVLLLYLKEIDNTTLYFAGQVKSPDCTSTRHAIYVVSAFAAEKGKEMKWENYKSAVRRELRMNRTQGWVIREPNRNSRGAGSRQVMPYMRICCSSSRHAHSAGTATPRAPTKMTATLVAQLLDAALVSF